METGIGGANRSPTTPMRMGSLVTAFVEIAFPGGAGSGGGDVEIGSEKSEGQVIFQGPGSGFGNFGLDDFGQRSGQGNGSEVCIGHGDSLDTGLAFLFGGAAAH